MIGPRHLQRLRNKLRGKSSNTSEESSSSLSTRVAIQNSGVEYEVIRSEGIQSGIMKVFIPDEMGPGQDVKIPGLDSGKLWTVIPPHSQWIFQNSGGKPRPFFFIETVDPVAAAPSRLRSTDSCRQAPVPEEHQSANAGKRGSFKYASGMVCQCALSEGVVDSFCPIHGTNPFVG